MSGFLLHLAVAIEVLDASSAYIPNVVEEGRSSEAREAFSNALLLPRKPSLRNR